MLVAGLLSVILVTRATDDDGEGTITLPPGSEPP